MDEKYSKRQIIFESEVEESPIYEDPTIDDGFDNGEDEEDDLTGFTDYGSLFGDDIGIGDDSDFEDDEEDDLTGFTDYGSLFGDDIDEEESSIDDFDINLDEQSSVDDFDISLDEEDLNDDNLEIIEEESEPDNELAILNKSIKLDLWLDECVEEGFLEKFLKYKSYEFSDEESLTQQIISNFKLEDLMEFKYKSSNIDIKPILKKLFLRLGVIRIVDVAMEHDVEVSLTKDGLIENFLNKFSPYELIILLHREGFKIFKYLNISALEQLYFLDNDELEDLSKGACFTIDGSRYKMLSCVLKHYKEGFLISHNKYNRGYDS